MFQGDNWCEYAIIWAADVGDPSSGKSVAQAAIVAPVERLQKLEYERLERAKIELERVAQQWKLFSPEEQSELYQTDANPVVFKKMHCIPRKWLLDKLTQQAMERRLSEQPTLSGSCWLKDELSGLFDSFDQFTGGKGDARQTLLTAWNKPLWGSVDRVSLDNSFQFTGQILNIAGGMQPSIASRIFQTKDDPDGLLSRFLMAVSKLPDNFDVWSDQKVNIFHLLSDIFDQLRQIEDVTVNFSASAKQIYVSYWQKLRKAYKHYKETNPAYAFFLGKQISYTARFVLILHLIDCVMGECDQLGIVTPEQVERAIYLSQFYCGQFRLLQANTVNSDSLAPDTLLFKVWEQLLLMKPASEVLMVLSQ